MLLVVVPHRAPAQPVLPRQLAHVPPRQQSEVYVLSLLVAAYRTQWHRFYLYTRNAPCATPIGYFLWEHTIGCVTRCCIAEVVRNQELMLCSRSSHVTQF